MDGSTWAVLIAAAALFLNFTDKVFGGGAKLSGRLSTIEAGMLSMQDEIKRLVETIGKIADMRGDIRVLDSRLLSLENDIRDLRRGEGWIKATNRTSIDGEYP